MEMETTCVSENLRLRSFLSGVVFIMLAATTAHLLFSHLGFNPTDDGFILAGSRRILDGEVPHRDFISIRTPGSYYIHIPFLLWTNEYLFWISRYFVWVQFASIAWIWTILVSSSFNVFQTLREKYIIAGIAFAFSANKFPIMAWHTVDAILLTSLGIALCMVQNKFAKAFGYFCIGLAPWCKQSFLPMIPVSLLLLGDYRKWQYWLVSLMAPVFFGAYLIVNGALSDAIIQLSARTDLMRVGVVKYAKSLPFFIGILMGGVASAGIRIPRRFEYDQRWLSWGIVLPLLLFVPPHAGAWLMVTKKLFGAGAFAILGCVVAVVIYGILEEKRLTNWTKLGLLVISTSWCASLSIGYNSPSLMSGSLVAFLIGFARFSTSSGNIGGCKPSGLCLMGDLPTTEILKRLVSINTTTLVVITLLAFVIARYNYIYREQPAYRLKYDLANVLPGAKLIKTNENTYAFLADLEQAKKIASALAKKYCVIPDLTVNWVRSEQPNPLSIDWPQSIELASCELVNRVIKNLENNRSRIVVIVEKYEAARLARGLVPLGDSYAIVNYVKENFDKIAETEFFDLYGELTP